MGGGGGHGGGDHQGLGFGGMAGGQGRRPAAPRVVGLGARCIGAAEVEHSGGAVERAPDHA
jgi:hypothetical protein